VTYYRVNDYSERDTRQIVDYVVVDYNDTGRRGSYVRAWESDASIFGPRVPVNPMEAPKPAGAPWSDSTCFESAPHYFGHRVPDTTITQRHQVTTKSNSKSTKT
jgi:hypothetical protein